MRWVSGWAKSGEHSLRRPVSIFRFFGRPLSRRNALKLVFSFFALLAAGGLLSKLKPVFAQAPSTNARKKNSIKGNYDLVAVKGEDPYRMTVKAVEAMGGMGRFVKKADTVVIKPNIGWDRRPEQSADTNPAVIAALVELCFKAGAKRVNVFDIPCNDPRRCYENSGIQQAAREKGANVYFADTKNTVKARFGYKSTMEGWPILKEALECDVFINVPVLKHHGLTGLTISMKNLMGVCGGMRALIHQNFASKLVDITDFINPELTVIDAFRFLFRNGPTGGNLQDVRNLNSVIVATDPTLADAYAAKLAGVDPFSIGNIRIAAERNFGNADINKANILSLKL